MNTRSLISMGAAVFACGLTAAASAQAPISVGPGFMPDPMTVNGTVGADMDASALDSACWGSIPATPQHIVTTTGAFNYLRFSVTSDTDTVLVIAGPNGVQCNDDTNGLNPQLDGAMPAGTYSVYVGSYGGGGGGSYALDISEFPYGGGGDLAATQPSEPIQEPATGGGQAMTIASGFLPDPMTQAGTSGGNNQASQWGAGCVGSVSGTPNHTITVNGDIPFLRLTATSDADATLVVVGPNGVQCNDDTHGFNPEVSGYFPGGTYNVYVGSYAGGSAPYTLEVSEFPRSGGTGSDTTEVVQEVVPAGNGVPQVTPGFLPDPMTMNGTSGGPNQGSTFGTSNWGPCRGSIPATPSHTFNLTSNFSFLRVYVEAASDTTLVITGPMGTMCNDDSNGFNPEIDGNNWAAGEYSVYVGAYSTAGPYTLNISELSN